MQGASQVSGSDYEQMLATVPFLAKAKLPAEVLSDFAKTARVRAYRAADEIVVQRHYGTSMFVLVSGKVHMTSMTPARDRFVPVATLAQAGEIFGEDALLGRGERMTTASAVTDVVALEIEKHRFDLLARRYPAVRDEIEQIYHHRAIATSLRTHPYLQGLAEPTITELAIAADLRMLARGELLARHRDLSDKVLLIKDGLVKATRASVIGGTSILAYFNTHDVITHGGEEQRDYELSAFGMCEVIEFRKDVFDAALAKYPAIAARLARDTLTRPAPELVSALAPVTYEMFNEGVEVESLLVIDLDRCVRCGNCVRACHARHSFARFERRGPIIERRDNHVLLPTSCRHCRDPECMIGCPTGAIQRFPDGDVDIDPKRCVGCENCARKCPYGNITMRVLPESERTDPEIKKRAIKCNLCRGYAYSNCVHECPRGAILRVDPLRYFEELADVMDAEQQAGLAWSRATFVLAKQRPRPRSTLFITASVVFGLLAAVAIIAYAVTSPIRPAVGAGLGFGITAAASIVVAGFQGVRKRMRNRAIGPLELWTQFHMVVGLLGFVAAAAHAGFSAAGVFTTFLLLVFALEVAIGILGQMLYATVPSQLTRIEQDGKLGRLVEDLHAEATTRAHRLDKLARSIQADRFAECMRLAGPLRLRFRRRYDPAQHLAAALAKLPAAETLLRDAVETRCGLFDARAQLVLHARMKHWLVAHVAIATTLVVLLMFHIITALSLLP